MSSKKPPKQERSQAFDQQIPDDYSDIEILDPENYQSDKFQVFNHQILVMNVMQRCIEARCHEMRSGWYNRKYDNQGNLSMSYVEDTRQKFINCVKGAVEVMKCDFDNEANEVIDSYIEQLSDMKDNLLKAQQSWWDSLTPKYKQQCSQRYGEIISGFFNEKLPWWQMYVEYETECYGLIFEELGELTRRLDNYQIADFEA